MAELHAIRSIFGRHSSRPGTFLLSDRAVSPWGDAIEQHEFSAGPFHSETVFFHWESRSLLLADLCSSGGQESDDATCGTAARSRPSIFPHPGIRLWTLGRRRLCRASVERVLEWPFTRIVPAHGAMVPENGRTGGREDGRTVFEAAFRWVWEKK